MALPISRFLFFDRTIGRRLYLIVLIMALGMLGILAIAAEQARVALLAAKATETRHLVETAHSLVADYQRRARAGRDDRGSRPAAGAGSSVAPALRTGPVFLGQRHGRADADASDLAALVGTNVLDLRDAAGARPFRDMIDIVARQSGGLYRYYWPPGADARLKQSYVAGRRGWNWVIGSGVYVDDVAGDHARALCCGSPPLPPALWCVALAGGRAGRGITRPISAIDRRHAPPGRRRPRGRGAGARTPRRTRRHGGAVAVFKDAYDRVAAAMCVRRTRLPGGKKPGWHWLAMADAIEAEAGQALA